MRRRGWRVPRLARGRGPDAAGQSRQAGGPGLVEPGAELGLIRRLAETPPAADAKAGAFARALLDAAAAPMSRSEAMAHERTLVAYLDGQGDQVAEVLDRLGGTLQDIRHEDRLRKYRGRAREGEGQ